MGYSQRVVQDQYLEVHYRQFDQSRVVRLARSLAGLICWPVILPLALVSRVSDFVFRSVSELLSLVPYLVGVIVRFEFYRWTITECGHNVTIGFGTVFFYRDVRIGDNVAIGNFNVIHHCDFGSYLVIADACHFLSGSKYHNFNKVDVPIALQGGKLRRIVVEDDCWVGVGSIIMADLAQGSVVGAGSVVTRPPKPFSVVVGNPAKFVRNRV